MPERVPQVSMSSASPQQEALLLPSTTLRVAASSVALAFNRRLISPSCASRSLSSSTPIVSDALLAPCRDVAAACAAASALPAVLRGLSVDVTSMDKAGCASLIAISAAALADAGQSAPQVFILGSTADSLQSVRNRLAAVSKETKVTTFDSLSGHVCVGTATDALKSGGMKGAKFVVVAGADELSSADRKSVV